MSQIPGWYPDPGAPQTTPPYLRYWDGRAWTDHTAAPPTAPTATTATTGYAAAGPTTPDGVPLAGWWMRVLAFLLDALIVGIPSFLIGLPQQARAQSRLQDLRDQLDSSSADMGHFWHGYFDIVRDQLLVQLPMAILAAAYFALMLRWKGATLGKLAVGLRVRLRDQPGRLPWRAIGWRVFVQNVLGILPYAALAVGWWPIAIVLGLALVVFAPLDGLWPLWDSKRQALHDKLARTNVVKAG